MKEANAPIAAKLVVEADDLRSAEQFADHLARKSRTESNAAFEFAEGRGFDELDMIEAMRDYEAADNYALAAARDEEVANTTVDWRDDGASEQYEDFAAVPKITIRLTRKQYDDLERQLRDLHDRLRPRYLTEEAARDVVSYWPEISVSAYLELIPALFSLAFESYVDQTLGTFWDRDRLKLTLATGYTGEEKPTLDDEVAVRIANQFFGDERYNLNAKCGFSLDPRWQEAYFEHEVAAG